MSLFRNLLDAVSSNLIAGDAYYLIIKGAAVTLFITFGAWLVTFLVGGLISYLMCYHKKFISGIAESVCFLFRSSPVLLLFLLLYYGTGGIRISGTFVAGLGLGLYGAGHFAELIAHSVKKAQVQQDAAVTAKLRHAYYQIAFPQALEESWFSVKRLFVQLLQWTTVAGYIGVNDLSSVMEGIGQRTMYPVFSILFSIMFYIVFTIVIELVFRYLAKRFAPGEVDN